MAFSVGSSPDPALSLLQIEGLLQKAQIAEEEAIKAAQGGESRAATPGMRPGFQARPRCLRERWQRAAARVHDARSAHPILPLRPAQQPHQLVRMGDQRPGNALAPPDLAALQNRREGGRTQAPRGFLRVFNPAHLLPEAESPGLARASCRVRNERIGGVTPLQGGGFTIRVTTARQERKKLEQKLEEVLQKRRLYEARDAPGGRPGPERCLPLRRACGHRVVMTECSLVSPPAADTWRRLTSRTGRRCMCRCGVARRARARGSRGRGEKDLFKGERGGGRQRRPRPPAVALIDLTTLH